MTYARITAGAIVEVADYKNLLAAWEMYGKIGLVGTFKCIAPLTERQTSRLPAKLRAMLVAG